VTHSSTAAVERRSHGENCGAERVEVAAVLHLEAAPAQLPGKVQSRGQMMEGRKETDMPGRAAVAAGR